MTDRDALLRQALESIERTAAAVRALLGEDEGRPLSVAQVAADLGVSRTFVREEIRAGRLKARRHGPKLWRVPVAELRAYKRRRSA